MLLQLSRTALVALALLSEVLVETTSLLAQDSPRSSVSLVATTTVSGRFRREAQAATTSVPAQVWKTLDDAGWRVQLAEFVVDAAPSLRGVRPNGWPRHLTWDNSDGLHLPASKLLILAEKRRNRAGEIVPSSRVAGVLRHELGHAFDMAAGRGSLNLSASTEFLRAYRSDVSGIAPNSRGSLSYYLQTGTTGVQETFAEAFAVVFGGGSSDIETTEFGARFPRVLAYTRGVIADPPPPNVVTAPLRVAPTRTARRRFLRRR